MNISKFGNLRDVYKFLHNESLLLFFPYINFYRKKTDWKNGQNMIVLLYLDLGKNLPVTHITKKTLKLYDDFINHFTETSFFLLFKYFDICSVLCPM